MSDIRIEGCKILIVEDEYILAEDLRRLLELAGAEVLGPVADSETAKDILWNTACDCAILDINLGGVRAFEVASLAVDKGIPAVFTTGYDKYVLPPELSTVEVFEKPVAMRSLMEFIARSVGSAD